MIEFDNILVPVTGAEADEETIKLACQLVKKNKGRIQVIYVITVKRNLPLDAEIESEIHKAESILDRSERIAEEENCEVDTELLQAREAGLTIVEEAAERKISLIVMGVRHKKRFGQFSLGDTVPYVLKNSPCRVILYHQSTQ